MLTRLPPPSRFEEWGNPKILEHYEYIRPIARDESSAPMPIRLLVRTSPTTAVMYWEPANYVAKGARSDRRAPASLKIIRHRAGGASGRYDPRDRVRLRVHP